MGGIDTDLTRRRSRIDAAQPETVDEHFKMIMFEKSILSDEHNTVTPKDLPDWFDDELFKIGQDYYTRNILGMSGAYLAGLFAVLLVPTISKILVATNQSSTPCTAFRRYLQTLLHIYNWHTYDYKDPESKFYKSINTVHWKHSTNSKRAVKRDGQGISQRDMVLTQSSFIAYVLLSPDVMALTNTPTERKGINHFWRVIGSLLGIPDRLNVCRADERETTLLCKKIRDEVFVAQLRAPNDDFFLLSSAAVDGLQCVDVMLDMDAFLAFFCDINSCENKKEMTLYSRCNYLYRKFMFSLMRLPIVGSVIRNAWNVYFRASYWLQERYPLVAWMKYGKRQSKITLYPKLTKE